MHSSLVTLLLVVGVAVADQVYNGQVYPDHLIPPNVPITDLHKNDDERGQFNYVYRSADGTTVQEQGDLKQTPDKTDYVLVKKGSYNYYDPSGKLIETKWTADENGFQATGDHLPQAS